METVTLKVDGMTCGGCVASVTRVLKATPGVSRRRGHGSKPNSATVTFDPARTSVPALKAAIEDAGYAAA